MENKFYYLIFISAVFASSFSQILLKKSANKKYPKKIMEYLNLYVMAAYFIYVIVTIVSIYALKRIQISYASALESLGYVFVAGLGWIFFNERISSKKILGLLIIMIGIIVICV